MKNFVWILIAIIISGCLDRDAEIISYGIAKNIVTQTEKNEDLISGEKHLIDVWNIIEKTEKIPNKVGTEFGIAYMLNEKTQNSMVEVEEIIIFPGEGLFNPNTGKAAKVDSEKLNIDPGLDQYFSYTLDYPWEAKSGIWIFQVKRHGEILIEKEFHVQ